MIFQHNRIIQICINAICEVIYAIDNLNWSCAECINSNLFASVVNEKIEKIINVMSDNNPKVNDELNNINTKIAKLIENQKLNDKEIKTNLKSIIETKARKPYVLC